MSNHKIICGDCIAAMRTFEANSIDSCVTDPPYGLEFMGKDWDSFNALSFQHFTYQWAAELYRVLKPGAHILVFGGTRTYHRMACAVEDTGFEVRDMIEWFYGTGFPKGLDISKGLDKTNGFHRGKAGVVLNNNNSMLGPNYERTDKGEPISEEAIHWGGWGTGLKPSHEPILLARKPMGEKSITANVLKWGVGGINIDRCRVPTNDSWDGKTGAFGSVGQTIYGDGHQLKGGMHQQGRFPANLILECCCEDGELIEGKAENNARVKKDIKDKQYGVSTYRKKGTGNGWGIPNNCEKSQIHINPNCICGILDKQSGVTESKAKSPRTANNFGMTYSSVNFGQTTGLEHTDKGGASRFFYQPKASANERWFYCSVCKRSDQIKNMDKHLHNAPNRTRYNHIEMHPTQKPLQLIQYLTKLITPPNGTTIDPFLGSGTGLIAAEREQLNCIGIDTNQIYCNISHQRFKDEVKQTKLTGAKSDVTYQPNKKY